MSRNDFPRTDGDLETRAHRRVRLKMGFFTHAFVYVCVNFGLFVLNMLHPERNWHFAPLLGWGFGLAIHGLVVFTGLGSGGLRDRMLQAEIAKLRRAER